jgi:hypothetical protein
MLAALGVAASAAQADTAPNGGVAFNTAPAAQPRSTSQAVPTPPVVTAPTTPAVDPTQAGGLSTTPKAAIPGAVAVIGPDGLASPPAGAPPAVQAAILAANQIVGKPYRYGGGHRAFTASAYDCSGAVSYALHGGDLVDDPLDSTSFFRWGKAGAGQWITVWTKSSHAFVVIAGLRFDTSAANDPSGLSGPRWRPALRSTRGFRARHPVGL